MLGLKLSYVPSVYLYASGLSCSTCSLCTCTRWAVNCSMYSLCTCTHYPADRIAQNRKAIVCPMIDVIDHDNFGYETQAGDAMRGAFDWEMFYKRIPIPAELQNQDPSEPFQSVPALPHIDLYCIKIDIHTPSPRGCRTRAQRALPISTSTIAMQVPILCVFF